mmetsp:Transcript_16452/g.15770  ORF Transcript_16452/g.15770 Transcript_16452/m.15770 type:complete len:95 (+) Transcript_16452:342-626(+)
MFESGVANDSKLAVYHNNSCQNGPILGNSCALFLARFLTTMLCRYKKACLGSMLDSNEFHLECYEEALMKTLLGMSLEDVNEHGRLLTIKDRLL